MENGQTETLWQHQYSNCDYGMFMLLPDGVVGHSTLPPAPNHGIAVRLPDFASTEELDLNKEPRYLWSNAEYNVSDDSSWKGTIDFYVGLLTGDKHGKISKQVTNLASLRAIRLKVAYKRGNELVVEEVVFAQRTGIVYEIGLRTAEPNYAQDVRLFEQLITGFRLSRLPQGKCSNG